MNLSYESLITGRVGSLLAADIDANQRELSARIGNSRIAVVGAAGSIGSAVVKTILRFAPRAVVLIDISENNLVELVRDLRSSPDVSLPPDFSTLPIAMGSGEFARYFAEAKPFDYFFNLAAIKHVRSEKDVYCLIRMMDTNVLFMHDFLVAHPHRFKKVFSVSSDKAANPANLMGASKMAMEKVLLHRSAEQPFSTARFANVAFSDGSLPYGFLRRIERQQALAAPNDVRRYFISHQEAGELCVLSAIIGENRDVFFPKLAASKDEKTFSQIAVDLLCELGYEPVLCSTEDEARRKAAELIPTRRWPCYFFASDTTGEKDYEEFYVPGEEVDVERFRSIGVIKRGDGVDHAVVEAFLDFAKSARSSGNSVKADYVQALERLVPTLHHLETGKNLDAKM
jgi:FlaA1/EpsC-like NDP-sugar epimerase